MAIHSIQCQEDPSLKSREVHVWISCDETVIGHKKFDRVTAKSNAVNEWTYEVLKEHTCPK